MLILKIATLEMKSYLTGACNKQRKLYFSRIPYKQMGVISFTVAFLIWKFMFSIIIYLSYVSFLSLSTKLVIFVVQIKQFGLWLIFIL